MTYSGKKSPCEGVVASVTSDDELAQTLEDGADALDLTLENADRILAAARELDKRLVADAFAAQAPGPGVLQDVKEEGRAAADNAELRRLELALDRAYLELQDKERIRADAERDLAAARASLRNERDRVKVLENDLQEERHQVELERRRREALAARCEELAARCEELEANLIEQSPAEPELPAEDFQDQIEEQQAAQRKQFEEIGIISGRLDRTLAELESHSRQLSEFVSPEMRTTDSPAKPDEQEEVPPAAALPA